MIEALNFKYCLAHYLHEICQQNKVNRKKNKLYNGSTSNYDSLLAKANKPSIKIKRYRSLALEIFKTLNDLNSTYLQDFFYLCFSSARQANNIKVVRTNTDTYRTKSLKSLGPQIWNSLPKHTCTFSKFDLYLIW